MKRSVMLAIIRGTIRYNIGYIGEVHEKLPELSEDILTTMETMGMKPPIKERCPVLFTDKFVWEKE